MSAGVHLRPLARLAAASVACLAALTVAADEADAARGSLKQLRGKAGCVSNAPGVILPRRLCARAPVVRAGTGQAMSPDGRNLYMLGGASRSDSSIAVLSRSRRSGRLSALPGSDGCLSNRPTERFGSCAAARVGVAGELVVSPDGQNAYLARIDGIAIFSRRPGTGALTQPEGQAGCVAEPDNPDGCATGRALFGTASVAISRDGRNVYVTGGSGPAASTTVAVFSRDPATGGLAQLPGPAGCLAERGSRAVTQEGCAEAAIGAPQSVAVSPDGRHVYVSARSTSIEDPETGDESRRPGGIAVLARDPGTGSLTQAGSTPGGGFEFTGASISPDGRSLYAWTREGELVLFSRASLTGALTRLGCFGGRPCRRARALLAASDVAVTRDGRSAYVAEAQEALVLFSRRANGSLRQPRGRAGCLSRTGAEGEFLPGEPRNRCRIGRTLVLPAEVTVSPDDRHVYVSGGRRVRGGAMINVSAFSRARR